MRTKFLLCIMAAAVLFVGVAASASADSSIYRAGMAPTLLQPNVLPVLVQVNDQGKITDVAPAFELRPQYRRLLVKTLKQMVTGPAHDKDGQAVASHVIMFMLAQSIPRADGQYDFSFTFTKAEPVPSGGLWYWGSNGHELALVQDFGRRPRAVCPGTSNRWGNICAAPVCDSSPSHYGLDHCTAPGQRTRSPDEQGKPAHAAQHAAAVAAAQHDQHRSNIRQPAGEHVYRLYKVSRGSAEAVALGSRAPARIAALRYAANYYYTANSRAAQMRANAPVVRHAIRPGVVAARAMRLQQNAHALAPAQPPGRDRQR